MFRSLVPAAERAVRPVVEGIKDHIHRILVALVLAAIGVACLITALSYIASSLRNVLLPMLGSVGTDLTLGLAYALAGACAILIGLGFARR